MSIGGGWEVFGITSLLVTLVVATSADPYPFRQDWKSYGKKSHSDYLSTIPLTEAMNEYILMMVDSFTKWADWCPSPPKSQK